MANKTANALTVKEALTMTALRIAILLTCIHRQYKSEMYFSILCPLHDCADMPKWASHLCSKITGQSDKVIADELLYAADDWIDDAGYPHKTGAHADAEADAGFRAIVAQLGRELRA